MNDCACRVPPVALGAQFLPPAAVRREFSTQLPGMILADVVSAGATIPGMDADKAMPQAQSRSTRLTIHDLERLPDDGLRHEIIDGEHYVTPSPNTRHQRLVGRLHGAFALYLRDHPEAGEAFLAPFDVVFSDFDVVEPDLLFICTDQRDIVTEKHVRGAPAIVVEVLSPGTRKVDEKIKYRLFERVGVREYWLVDPELDLVKVYRRASDGSLPRVAELSAEGGDTLATPLLPGLPFRSPSFSGNLESAC